MSNDFVVMGTRPPSALSSYRPVSAGRKHNGYHSRAQPSFVDESLFGSQHHTRLDEEFMSFKAPWEYPKPPPPRNTFAAPPKSKLPVKPKPKGRPLLWCPSPDAAVHVRTKTTKNLAHSDGAKSNQGALWNTRNNFRHLKHTPTFVDESLFGPRLQEPTFEAPWNERKKGEKRTVRPFLFYPSSGSTAKNGFKQRPATALGLSKRDTRNQQTSSSQRQVWKP
ncbi:hypothetical protein EGW08_000622 [Elysia chlorotica]|uniref:RBPJ-interacting and tubulin-associated protein 1 n=1 Tax=Elysia chlorotica TaxID=188477 RepID=A0A3S1A671_ELYCH|nr:hypothetical protein EGW08_000622 [Elysia chlorotica]